MFQKHGFFTVASPPIIVCKYAFGKLALAHMSKEKMRGGQGIRAQKQILSVFICHLFI